MVGAMKKRVLFLCTHNSARSQMAEGLLRHLYGDRYEAFSAGTHPSKVHPYAVKVMAEIGIDISNQYSKTVSEFSEKPFDYVITVCDRAKAECPFFPNAKAQMHWGFPDPSDAVGDEAAGMDVFRATRDAIRDRIVGYFGREGGPLVQAPRFSLGLPSSS